MAYLGNVPAEAYSSIDKQVITGDGGTSYTLDHSVANENEIEVFVNNVRQEPSVAYTVSGTALTMTGNVESSDDFYVVFQGKAIQTTVHPSGQTINASNGNLSGNLTTNDATSTITSSNPNETFGNVFKAPSSSYRSAAFAANKANSAASVWWTDEDQAAVGAIDGVNNGGLTLWVNDGSNWTQVAKVDVSGYFLQNRNVAFSANLDDGNTYAQGWNDIIYDESVTQRGTSYNSTTGIFTAPVDGWYHFSAQTTFNANTDNDGTLSICVDNNTSDLIASVSQSSTGGTSVEGQSCSGTGYLSKNQTVRIKRYFSVAGAVSRGAQQYAGWFSGFLIG